MATSRPTPIPHSYHSEDQKRPGTTRNDRWQNRLLRLGLGRFSLVSGHPEMVVLGLITRRSRVQIPPPLLKALVSDLQTRASTVQKRSSPGSLPSLPLSLPGLSSHI